MLEDRFGLLGILAFRDASNQSLDHCRGPDELLGEVAHPMGAFAGSNTLYNSVPSVRVTKPLKSVNLPRERNFQLSPSASNSTVLYSLASSLASQSFLLSAWTASRLKTSCEVKPRSLCPCDSR